MKLALDKKKKFFVAVGYRRPHIPWRMPQRYWDLYDREELPLSNRQHIGKNVSTLGYVQCGFSSPIKYQGKEVVYGPNRPLPEALQRSYRRGYYASVSWLDSQIGRLLEALDTLGVANNTVVALWGDHGWKLGEHSGWSKQDIWELGSRVPLIIRTPFIAQSVGIKTYALAETVDMYKTLTDLAGLPQPPASEGVEGTSLAPIVRNPLLNDAAGVKTLALTQFPRCHIHSDTTPWADGSGQSYACMGTQRTQFEVMGYAARTKDWRYIEWRKWKNDTLTGDWSPQGLLAAGLYDHRADERVEGSRYFDWPGDFDNVADNSEFKEFRLAMAKTLKDAFVTTSVV
eukprot:UC1_evm1s285